MIGSFPENYNTEQRAWKCQFLTFSYSIPNHQFFFYSNRSFPIFSALLYKYFSLYRTCWLSFTEYVPSISSNHSHTHHFIQQKKFQIIVQVIICLPLSFPICLSSTRGNYVSHDIILPKRDFMFPFTSALYNLSANKSC